MKNIRVFLLVVIVFGVACSPVTPAPIPLSTPQATPVVITEYPVAVTAAVNALTALLQVPVESIVVKSYESVEWPDSCLGIPMPEMCAQVITPGWRVVLESGGKSYQYHTNEDGSRAVQASAPLTGQSMPDLIWMSASGEDLAAFNADGVSYGSAHGAMTTSAWPSAVRQAHLTELVGRYASFDAQTQAGMLNFRGQGTLVATESEQRAITEWVMLVMMEAQGGRGGAAWGLAFSYARNGGIAGFCDNLGIYRDGEVYYENCKGIHASQHLTATQLEQLYGWIDRVKSYEYHYADPAIADAMSIDAVFYGDGQESGNDEILRPLLEFASELVAQASIQSNAPAEVTAAEKSLTDFFMALNSGDYIQAAKLYGGDTSVLEGWNPDIKNNLPQWFERGCTQNGLNCLLPRSITYHGSDARSGYQFYVEFSNADGTLFRQGPCCGDASGAASTTFVFGVAQNGESWLVMDLPPYTP